MPPFLYLVRYPSSSGSRSPWLPDYRFTPGGGVLCIKDTQCYQIFVTDHVTSPPVCLTIQCRCPTSKPKPSSSATVFSSNTSFRDHTTVHLSTSVPLPLHHYTTALRSHLNYCTRTGTGFSLPSIYRSGRGQVLFSKPKSGHVLGWKIFPGIPIDCKVNIQTPQRDKQGHSWLNLCPFVCPL